MPILKIIVVNAIILLGLLLVAEWTLWQLYPDYSYYYRSHPAQPDLEEILARTDTTWLAPDAELGWVCQQKANLLFPSPPVENVYYQINEQGFRNHFDFQDSIVKGKKRVLLIGDSFMFGIYLPEQQTIAGQLQQALGSEYLVYNLAMPAWGFDQMYLAYQKYVERIQPDQVILAFVNDDIMRTMEILFHGCGRKPSFKLVDHQLYDNIDNPSWWEYLCWNNQLGNRILLGHYQRKAVELTRFMLEEIIHNEQAQGRSPIVLRIPRIHEVEKRISNSVFSMKEICDIYETPYLELYQQMVQRSSEEVQSFYIPEDGHFTLAGSRFFVDNLLSLWQKESDSLSSFQK